MEIILIGGSEGLLGSHLRDEFLLQPDTVVFGFDLKRHTSIENNRYFYVSGSINNVIDVNTLSNVIKQFQDKNNIGKSMNAIINCITEPDFSYSAESIPVDLPEEEWLIWGWKNYPCSEFEMQTNTNVVGTHRLLTSIFERYSESKNCSIVNLTSQYSLRVPNQDLFKGFGRFIFKGPGYSASKTALVNYTQYLANVFSGSGIRANCIALGSVLNGQKKEFIDKYSKSTLSGRMMLPNEITAIVKFLISNESSYITGSCLVADGGWSIK